MPDEVRATARRRRQRARRRRRLIASGVGLVAVGAGGFTALAATSTGAAGQRLATVSRGAVTQIVESSGTIASSARVDAVFPVAGTVVAVPVTVGQAVTRGSVLARVDPTDLQAAVDSANQSVADAKQQLAADQTGQTSAAAGGNGASTSGATSRPSTSATTNAASFTVLTPLASVPSASVPSATSRGSTPLSLLAGIRAAQHAVTTGQRAVDTDQIAVDAADQKVAADVTRNSQLRDAQKAACTVAADGTGGPASDGCASARADYETFADKLTADTALLHSAVSEQDGAVSHLDAAIIALDELLGRLSTSTATSGGSTATGSTGSTRGGNTSSPSGSTTKSVAPTSVATQSTGAQSSGSNTAQPASAARLAADQASIDAAEAKLHEAEQNRQAATLRSSLTGRVAAIAMAAGESSSGGSVTVIGTGVQQVRTTVTLAQVNLVKVGQSVSVSADGHSAPLHGTVAAVGILSSTSGSTTTFPVTVRLDAGSPRLFDGSGADVRITTGTARNVVTVPDSAIRNGFGGRHTVTVWKNGKATPVPVGFGIAGPDVTQVTSGLQVGDRVVLADYGTSLPTTTTADTTNRLLTRLRNGGSFGG